jgi:hypothetical protein
MTTEEFKDGHIVEYPYLWKWESELGRDEGEKNRPACLAMVVKDKLRNLTYLVILPISGTPPKSDQIALEIPALELKRAGLADAKRGWITVSEYNYDILERSWDFPVNRPPLGRFSRPFFRQIERAFLPTLRSKQRRADRTL